MNLTFREGVAEDRAAIEEMTREVWGGHDYLAAEWADWVAAPGWLRVGLLEGRIVCTGRLRALSPGEGWIEGIRVDPTLQGRGLASAIYDHLLGLARQEGDLQTLGFATAWTNERMHHLARRSGMVQWGDYRYLRADPVTPRERSGSDGERAWLAESLAASPWVTASGGHLMDGWLCRRITAGWLDHVLQQGALIGDAGGWALLRYAGDEGGWLLAMDGAAAALPALVERAREAVGRATPGRPLRLFVPERLGWADALRAAGLRDPDGGPFRIYHFQMALRDG